MARSVCLALPARCSDVATLWWRMNLSVSPDVLARFTPFCAQARWARARSDRASRFSV